MVDGSLENEDDLTLLDGVELLVKSPGVPGERPLVEEARRRGIPVWSEVELGWSLLAPRGTRFVGVTGTNGKTTTAELLGAIFRAAGRDVAVAGNVGTPLSSVEAADWVVCEVSSFQLEDVHAFACDVAVVLNLEPDHLDRHGSFEAYRAAKLRILERAGVAVVPRGLGLDGIEFSADDPLPAEPLIRGAHNRENAAAATAAARAAGIDDDAIAAGAAHLSGRSAPAGAGRRGRRRPLRERLEGDERRRRVARPRGVLGGAGSPDPRRLAERRELRPARRCDPGERQVDPLVGAAGPELAAALGAAISHEDGTLSRAVSHAASSRRARVGRPPQPRLRELRPVRELRAPRRGVQSARRRARHGRPEGLGQPWRIGRSAARRTVLPSAGAGTDRTSGWVAPFLGSRAEDCSASSSQRARRSAPRPPRSGIPRRFPCERRCPERSRHTPRPSCSSRAGSRRAARSPAHARPARAARNPNRSSPRRPPDERTCQESGARGRTPFE